MSDPFKVYINGLVDVDFVGKPIDTLSSMQQATTVHKKPTAGNIMMAYVTTAEQSDLLLCYAADHQQAKWSSDRQALHTITVTVQYPDLEGFVEKVTQEMGNRGIESTARFRKRGWVNTCLYTFLEPRPELGKEVEALMRYFQKRYSK